MPITTIINQSKHKIPYTAMLELMRSFTLKVDSEFEVIKFVVLAASRITFYFSEIMNFCFDLKDSHQLNQIIPFRPDHTLLYPVP